MAKATQLGKTGLLGEKLALKYLKSHKFSIIDTNVTYKFGELDIVAKKGSVYYFFEVKARDVDSSDLITLEERLSDSKLHRIRLAVEAYVKQHELYDQPTQVDAILVTIDSDSKLAKIKRIERII